MKKVSPSPEIKSKFKVFQHKLTHEIIIVHDYRSERLFKDYNVVIEWTDYYPYTQLNPFAAYLIPHDLEIGERVFISDVIEDLVGSRWNQGDVFRLETCEAIWTGNDLLLDYKYPGDNYTIYG
ncbi:hypothetical protein E4S40_10685 [Algoriphagus kandeliae]|uniref:Uncharacterized protein n=1 Tax=Algoriphagus kandeliae TaxID=2562278 RepID=A0A4Y9QPF8_9BACT|nr:hypothetical protein [Algoriphagus kandeliae]TFV94479.1 hypothetical protein E4S40_10685 [Algoriphagus kandeliae]